MMELTHQRGPSLWGALVWKDFQQVKQTFVAVLAGVFCLQCILLFAASLMREGSDRSSLYGSTVTFACVAPILLALGCSGMLIGQERQSGTWAWSSSLPVSWSQALGSKLLVSVFGSLVATIPLLIIPIGLWATRRLDTGLNSVASIHASWLTCAIFLEVIVFCFFTAALLRETLAALVLAGIGITVVQVLIVIFSLNSSGYVLFVSITLLIGFLLMSITIRWRWGIGQQATLTLRRNSLSVTPLKIAAYQPLIGNAPSEWQMMLRHSVANSIWLRVTVLLWLVVSILTAEWSLLLEILTPFVSVLSLGILGVTTFEGDQALNRIRFLADRGVVPWKFVLSRLSVSMIFGLIATAIAIPVFGTHRFSHVSWSSVCLNWPSAFLVGAFASMSFRKSIVALLTTVAVVAISYAITVLTLDLAHNQVALLTRGSVWNEFGYFLPVAHLAILLAIFVSAHRWLVFDKAILAPHFLWIAPLSLLSPLALTCTFGFLFVPNVPWNEMRIETRPPGRQVLPEVLSFSQPLVTDYIGGDYQDIEFDLNMDLKVNNLVKDGSIEQTLRVMQVIEPLLDPLEEALRTGQRPMGVELQYTHYAWSLRYMIARTAGLARISMLGKDPQSALRFWRVNRELQEISAGFDLRVVGESRYASMKMLSLLTEDEVAQLGGKEIYEGLIPSAFVSNDYLWHEANQLRSDLRRSWVAFYSPLRWRLERELAWTVQEAQSTIDRSPLVVRLNEIRRTLLVRVHH